MYLDNDSALMMGKFSFKLTFTYIVHQKLRKDLHTHNFPRIIQIKIHNSTFINPAIKYNNLTVMRA